MCPFSPKIFAKQLSHHSAILLFKRRASCVRNFFKSGYSVCSVSGEFHLRLRQLEKCLLQALNEAKGKILDDDSVITTLETLKQEAADISKKVEETDKVIAEIETVSQQYKPLSQVRNEAPYVPVQSVLMKLFIFQLITILYLRILLF